MAPTSSRPKITSSSFGLSTTGERLGGKKTTIKISSLEKSSLKNLVSINNTLDSILNTLTGAQKEEKKLSDKQRKEEENKRRSERERGLESKVFDGIKTAVKTVMKPFTSIWDWITNFLFNVFLGKVVIKLLNWFADPKNKDKIKSIIRFFKDWWPTMLGAYILFGTSFGKLARGLVTFAGKSVIGLGKVIYRLIAAIAKGRALKASGALSGGGGGPGRAVRGGGGLGGALLKGGLLIGGSLLAGAAIDKGVESFTGGGEEDQQAQIDVPDSPEIPMLNAATGGLADIGKIFGSLGGGMMGSMFGPLGMLMGSMMGGNLPNIFQGLVSGKKGTDKIPAMLTDGEFVMSKGAVQKYGVDTLEAMNAAGGGTNIPKIIKGIPHAAGGGLMGQNPNSPNQEMKIEDLARYANEMTVKIRPGDSENTGSGVIVKNDNGNYTVLTANHVLKGTRIGTPISIRTVDGKVHQTKLTKETAKRIGEDKNIDMASIQFSSSNNYRVARPGNYSTMKPDDEVFASGFPLMTESIPIDAMRFSKGKILQNEEQSLPSGYNMMYSNTTFPGMSGGPILNTRGELIGIHGQGGNVLDTIQKERGSRAMPIQYYTESGGTFGSTQPDTSVTTSNASFSKLNPKVLRKEDLEVGRENEIAGGLNEKYKSLGYSPEVYENSYILGPSEQIKPYQAPYSPVINGPTSNYNLIQPPTISTKQQRKSSTIRPPVRPAPITVVSGLPNAERSPVTSGSRPTGDVPSVKATSGSSQSSQSARQKGIG